MEKDNTDFSKQEQEQELIVLNSLTFFVFSCVPATQLEHQQLR